MRVILVSLMLLLPATAAWAAVGPVNPSVVEATAPTTNADGTPLTDLKALGFCVSSSPTAPPLTCVDADSPTPSPTGQVIVGTPIAAFGLTQDGDYFVDVDAVDLVGNRSAKTARVPFELNVQAPAVPSTPTFR